MKKEFFKSVLAGIMVAIAGQTQLSISNKYVGAFLFAVALIVICVQGYNLYTGKVGYVSTKKQFKECLFWLIGNLIGASLIACVVPFPPIDLINYKLSIELPIVLWNACWCGFLMYVAVSGFKKNSYLSILYCIPTFILAGFEHSIADAYYLIAARAFSFEAICFLFVVIIGNAIGAKLANLAEK